MRILFNDIIQYSSAPKELKSPALADAWAGGSIRISFDRPRPVNSIGIGFSSGTVFNAAFNDAENTVFRIDYAESGLYVMDKTITASVMEINSAAAMIGRLGAGVACSIPTKIAKEPAYNSTAEPRLTLGGHIIAGRGGYIYRSISLDSRYQITPEAVNEIKEGYYFIGQGYPFFIDLSDEGYKLPFSKLYANEKNQHNLSFESGIKKYLYSRKWQFEERF